MSSDKYAAVIKSSKQKKKSRLTNQMFRKFLKNIHFMTYQLAASGIFLKKINRDRKY